MKKKLLQVILALVLLLSCLFTPRQTIADLTDSAPLDIVVVVDNSGSMNRSDRERMIGQAIKMLVNMMPCDSHVGVIGFNSKPTVLTKDANGQDALISLEDVNNVTNIKAVVDAMVYDGHTGIGNAIKAAADLLEIQGRTDAQKAIILFTDGLDDLESEVEYQNCNANQTDAVYWAKNSGTPIYSIGLNYTKDDGTNTLGANGEGTQKLGGISEATGATYTEISNINEVEKVFIDILAEVRQLYYNEIATIPGDGQEHEITFNVNASVIEANIRISCNTQDALTNGSIILEDPSGTIKDLYQDAAIRTDIESTAISIKLISPAAGTWKLRLSGIVGDDVKIGMLEHYSLGLELQLENASAAVIDTAYQNDTVTLRAFLTASDQRIADEAVYQQQGTSVTATVVPRVDPNAVQEITLIQDGASFSGSFWVGLESAYDIYVRLNTSSYYRDAETALLSANKPFVLNKTQLLSDYPEIALNVKKELNIDQLISQYTYDNENDAVTASISYLDNPDAADVMYDASLDQVKITGKKWGSAIATITFVDAQNNMDSVDIKIKVKDPLLLFILVAGPIVGIILIVLIVLFISFKALNMIPGELTVTQIIWEGEEKVSFRTAKTMRANLFLKKGKNLWGLISQYAQELKQGAGEADRRNISATILSNEADGQKLRSNAAALKFAGTVRGKKGILVKASPKSKISVDGSKMGKKVKKYLKDRSMTFIVYLDDRQTKQVTIEVQHVNSVPRRGQRNRGRNIGERQNPRGGRGIDENRNPRGRFNENAGNQAGGDNGRMTRMQGSDTQTQTRTADTGGKKSRFDD